MLLEDERVGVQPLSRTEAAVITASLTVEDRTCGVSATLKIVHVD